MALAYLTLVALGRGDVHLLAGTSSLTLRQGDALAAGVELRQAVVVPQDAIALAGDEHGQTNLRVHLRQPARQSAHVAIAILELAETIEMLILGRSEGERRHTVLQVMGCGAEHGLAGLVLHGDARALDGDAQVGLGDDVVPDIKPVGQVAGRSRFTILYAHGTGCDVSNFQNGASRSSGSGHEGGHEDKAKMFHVTLLISFSYFSPMSIPHASTGGCSCQQTS